MTGLLLFVISLSTLALAVGVFASPSPSQSRGSLLGAGVGVGFILLVDQSGVGGWALLVATLCVFMIGGALPWAQNKESGGWQNWFMIVITASSTWMLSLFLLWTLEEAFSIPVNVLTTPPTLWETVNLGFDGHLWALTLVTCLAVAVGWGALDTEVDT